MHKKYECEGSECGKLGIKVIPNSIVIQGKIYYVTHQEQIEMAFCEVHK